MTLFNLRGIVLISFCLAINAQIAMAGQVSKVNNAKKQTVLTLDSEEVETLHEGDELYSTQNGAKKALLQITKIKGKRALAKIIKGKVVKGQDLLLKAGTESSVYEGASKGGKNKLELGVLFGFAMDKQTTKNASGTASLAGNGMSLKAMGDMSLMGAIGVRAEVGLEQFKAKASKDGLDYKTDINYLDVGVAVRYRLIDTRTKVFVAIGMDILVPVSKTVQRTVDEASVAPTTVLNLKGGAHFPVGRKYFVPVQADYYYFPPSSDVTTSIIAVRGGFGMYF